MSKEKKNLPAKSDKASFLDKVRSSKTVSATSKVETLKKALLNESRPRLLFAMDATASREQSWNVALEITGAMFESVPGALDVALAYHSGGQLREITPFSSSAKVFLDKVQTVRCTAGMTALNGVLDRACGIRGLKALIYVGDCFEEDSSRAIEIAKQLKLKQVRCFMFHDTSSSGQGYDVQTAAKVFASIAQITGGALLPFDETSPQLVKALLEAIAIYAAKGINALEKKRTSLPAARLLLDQIRGS